MGHALFCLLRTQQGRRQSPGMCEVYFFLGSSGAIWSKLLPYPRCRTRWGTLFT
jgi:hypothetical protein